MLPDAEPGEASAPGQPAAADGESAAAQAAEGTEEGIQAFVPAALKVHDARLLLKLDLPSAQEYRRKWADLKVVAPTEQLRKLLLAEGVI